MRQAGAVSFVINVVPILIVVASIFFITVISSIIVVNWVQLFSVRFCSLRFANIGHRSLLGSRLMLTILFLLGIRPSP